MNKGGEIDKHLPKLTMADANKAEEYAAAAAIDSTRVVVGDLLTLHPANRRMLTALEINLGRERLAWKRLAVVLRAPSGTPEYGRALDALSDAQHEWVISWEGVDALYDAQDAAAKAIVRSSTRNGKEANEAQRRLSRQSTIAAAALYAGFLLCFGLVSYAVTGKPGSIALPGSLPAVGQRKCP